MHAQWVSEGWECAKHQRACSRCVQDNHGIGFLNSNGCLNTCMIEQRIMHYTAHIFTRVNLYKYDGTYLANKCVCAIAIYALLSLCVWWTKCQVLNVVLAVLLYTSETKPHMPPISQRHPSYIPVRRNGYDDTHALARYPSHTSPSGVMTSLALTWLDIFHAIHFTLRLLHRALPARQDVGHLCRDHKVPYPQLRVIVIYACHGSIGSSGFLQIQPNCTTTQCTMIFSWMAHTTVMWVTKVWQLTYFWRCGQIAPPMSCLLQHIIMRPHT